MKPAVRSNLVSAAVVLVILAGTLFLARRPYYNWDMFPYMALVMERDDVPFEKTHEHAYNLAEATMLPFDFVAISARQPVLHQDPKAFEEILPYYKIKPGYNLTVSALYSLGLNPLTATWLPSIAAYFALGLICYLWARRTGPALAAALFTFVIIFSPVMTDLARYSSPDMLCTLFSVAGLLFIMSSRTTVGLAFLTIAVTIRPDAAILGILIIVALWVQKKLSTGMMLCWAAGQLLILYFLFSETDLVNEYTFLDYHISDRLDLYAESFPTLIRSFTLPMIMLSLLLIYLQRKEPGLPSLLLWAAILSIIARIVLHPFVEDRFNLPAYFVILLFGWQQVTARLFPQYWAKAPVAS